MEDYQEYMYKLETHLKSIGTSNEEYANLYATWELNKKTYRNVLKTVIMNYPHYSLHDDTHSDSIITNIEMLLGEERIKRLSPTDTWMLLHCAYLHDFGMALLYKKIEEEWQTEEFQLYLKEQKNLYDKDLIKAIDYIENLANNLQKEKFEVVWPLKVRKYVTYIIADYFRAKHSNLTKEYLNMLSNWDIDISHNEFIQERIIKLIGEISFLHTQNFDKVMELNYKSNGYKSDYIHPRFVAEMIRIGDLLDLDNGRFSSYTEKVNGELPRVSKNHKEKHKSTKHVLVTPKEIEITIDCYREEVYREAKNWVRWIDEEIKNLTMNWIEIIPNTLTGYAPKLTRKEVLLKGSLDFNNIADLRFNISQEKAFDIIEGSKIYEDTYIFLREFLQNALDATKIQLWRDLKNELYLGCYKDEKVEVNDLLPFDIKDEIYKNYKLEIIIKDKTEKEVEVIIKDKGIGISIDTLKSICNVGSSYSGNLELKKEISEMPLWLRPTGGFGIGVQSAFLVSNIFRAYTKTEGNNVLEIIFESRKFNGYIQVVNSDKDLKRGTEFHINMIMKDKESSMPLNGYEYKYITEEYDPMIYENTNIYKVLDGITKSYSGDLFPIDIKIKNNIIPMRSSNIINFSRKDFLEVNSFMYKMSEDLSNISIWHKPSSSYIRIEMKNVKSVDVEEAFVYFKGMYVERISNNTDSFIRAEIDIYGLDTKQTLKITRKELTLEGKNQVKEIIGECKRLYLNILKEKIDKSQNISISNLSKLGFIILGYKLLENFNPINYKELESSQDSNKIWVLEKENAKIVVKEKTLREFFNAYPNLSYIRIGDAELYEEIYRGKYEILEDIIPTDSEFGDNLVLIENNIIKLLNNLVVKEVRVLDDKNDVFLYKTDEGINNIGVKVDKKAEEHFIKSLVYEEENSIMFRFIASNRQRSRIPAIEKYSDLSVSLSDVTLMRGLGNYNCNSNKIISPITLNDKKNINSYVNKETFISSITNREDYRRLLKYTMENRISKEKISEEEIDEKYKELIGQYFEIVREYY